MVKAKVVRVVEIRISIVIVSVSDEREVEKTSTMVSKILPVASNVTTGPIFPIMVATCTDQFPENVGKVACFDQEIIVLVVAAKKFRSEPILYNSLPCMACSVASVVI